MTIGADVKWQLRDIGVGFNIVRDLGTISGEFCYTEPNAQATKPFIREFFLESWFQYDTSVVEGDLIQFTTTNTPYLVMNKTPDIVENGIIKYDGVLYKCNTSGEFLRPSTAEVNYRKTNTWTSVKTNAYSLMTGIIFGSGIEEENQLIAVGLSRNELYVPERYGIKQFDRYYPVSGEQPYIVNKVVKRRFPGIDVCELVEDNRQ